MCMLAQSSGSETPWAVALQASLCIELSGQEYWIGLPFPLPGDLPNPGIKPASSALAGRFFTTEPPGKLTVLKPFSGPTFSSTREQLGAQALGSDSVGSTPASGQVQLCDPGLWVHLPGSPSLLCSMWCLGVHFLRPLEFLSHPCHLLAVGDLGPVPQECCVSSSWTRAFALLGCHEEISANCWAQCLPHSQALGLEWFLTSQHNVFLLLLLLNHFSRVRLCATP